MKRSLLILVFFAYYTLCYSQDFLKKNWVDVCNKLIKIDSTEFKKKYVKQKRVHRSKTYKKSKGVISIQTPNKVEVFKDDYRMDNYATFSVFGEDTTLHWVIIIETHEHDDDAYIINTQTSKVWNLLAKPVFYSDKIICFERPPDNPDRIHVLSVSGNEITSEKFLRIRNCDANFWGVQKFYYKDNVLYFQDEKDNYFKVKIDF